MNGERNSLEDIVEILAGLKTDINDYSKQKSKVYFKKSIELVDVSFKYNNDHDLFYLI